MTYQWLLFDADGTLFDFEQAETNALRGTFMDLNLPFNASGAETYSRINKQIWGDFENGRITSEALRTRRFELLFEELGITTDVEQFSQQYLVNLSQQTVLLDGTEETLRALAGAYNLAIITNGLKDVQRPRLALSTIGGYFKAVAISEEIGAAKPDPRFFAAAFEMIGNPPKDQALVIGDSLTSDIAGGNQFGLDTCWFNPQGKTLPPTYAVRYEILALKQLRDLLGK